MMKKIFVLALAGVMCIAVYQMVFADNNPIQPGINYNASVDTAQRIVVFGNSSSGFIGRGTPVALVSYNGGYKVLKADADGAASVQRVLGVMDQPTAPGTDARIVTSGLVSNIDTSSFSVGAKLYLSTAAGTLTATKPTGTVESAPVAIVLRSSATAGEIMVNAMGRIDDTPATITGGGTATFGTTTTVTIRNGNYVSTNGSVSTKSIAVNGHAFGTMTTTIHGILRTLLYY